MAFWKRLARALNPGTQSHDAWKRVWDARQASLERILGPAHEEVFHAPIPLNHGGGADVLVFDGPASGETYVTADLSGQEVLGQSTTPGFELMICTRAPSVVAPNIISRLAPYCLEHTLAPGHTMQIDMDPAAPVHALIFTKPDLITPAFHFLGHDYFLLLAIGISKQDLDFSFTEGPDALLHRLREQARYPFTSEAAA